MKAWKKNLKDKWLVEVALPSEPRQSFPDVSLGDAIQKYDREIPIDEPSKKGRYNTMWAMKNLLRVWPPETKLKDLDGNTLLKYLGAIKTQSLHKGSALALCRFIKLGHRVGTPLRNHREPNFKATIANTSASAQEVTIKFSSLNVSELEKIMPVETAGGRFAPVKLRLYRHIKELPSDQVGVFQVGTIANNPKELKKLYVQLSHFLTKELPDWEIRWNPLDKIFIVATKKQWEGK